MIVRRGEKRRGEERRGERKAREDLRRGFVWTVIGSEIITKCSKLHSFMGEAGREG